MRKHYLNILSIVILSFSFSIPGMAQNLDIPPEWTNCSEFPGNINNSFTATATSVIQPFWHGILGKAINEVNNFIVYSNEHAYTGDLAGKDMFYIVRINAINPSSSVVIGSSTVDLTYSLYINCIDSSVDITAYRVNNNDIVIGDDKIDEAWSSIENSTVEEFSNTIGTKTFSGWIKSAHDDNFLYTLVAFVNETPFYWFAFEFNATQENMVNGSDGWIFGTGFQDYTGDGYYNGDSTHPTNDIQNDVEYEIGNLNNEHIYYEIKRSLETNDAQGNDISFKENQIYTIKFASATHHLNERQIYTLALSDSYPNDYNTDPLTTTTISKETTTSAVQTPTTKSSSMSKSVSITTTDFNFLTFFLTLPLFWLVTNYRRKTKR